MLRIIRALFSNSANDEPIDKQKKDIEQTPHYMMMPQEFEDGRDSIPSGYGPFGYSLTNPIPVNGPIGESVYINRLRSKSGVGFMYQRCGSMPSQVYKHPLDHFDLVAVDGSERHQLYFAMYFRWRSTKAPEGLSLLPWSGMEAPMRMMCKLDCFGTKGIVSNFPIGLPKEIAANPVLNHISPGLGLAMAKRVTGYLETNRDKWSNLMRK